MSSEACAEEACCPHYGWKHSITWAEACQEYAKSCMLVLLLLVRHTSMRQAPDRVATVEEDQQSNRSHVGKASSSSTERIPRWALSFLYSEGPDEPWVQIAGLQEGNGDDSMVRWGTEPNHAPAAHWAWAYREAAAAATPSFGLARQICGSRSHVIRSLCRISFREFLWSAESGPLFAAIAFDLPDVVQSILTESRELLNICDKLLHLTPIFYALQRQNTCIEAIGSMSGADFTTPDKYGQPPCIWVVENGKPELLKRLVALATFRAGVNSRDSRGRTALMLLASKADAVRMSILLPVPGIDINLVAHEGGSALHAAATGPKTEHKILGADRTRVLQLLLERNGIDVNVRDFMGRTTLMLCCQNLGNQPDLLHPLMTDPNSDVNAQDSEGNTALMYLCQTPIGDSSWVAAVHREWVYAFLRRTVELSMTNLKGRTALQIAMEANPGIVDILQQHQQHLQEANRALRGIRESHKGDFGTRLAVSRRTSLAWHQAGYIPVAEDLSWEPEGSD